MVKERRQSARLVDALAFKISFEGYDITSETLNLSTSGLLCRVHKNIPLMTQIDIILLIPDHAKGESVQLKIKAKGVVVRAEKDAQTNMYKLAIFLTQMTKTHKERFETYIRKKMNKR